MRRLLCGAVIAVLMISGALAKDDDRKSPSPSPKPTVTTPRDTPKDTSRFGLDKGGAKEPPANRSVDQGTNRFGLSKDGPAAKEPAATPQNRFGLSKEAAPAPEKSDNRFGLSKEANPPGAMPNQGRFDLGKNDQKPAGTAPQIGASALGSAVTKKMSGDALAKFDADQNRFAKPPSVPHDTAALNKNPIWTQSRDKYKTPDDVIRAREDTRRRLAASGGGWQPPAYAVQQGPPSFGNWASEFLWNLLGSAGGSYLGNAVFAYSHRDDPGYQAWHREAEREAMYDDNVRSRLDALDARVNQLAAKNTPPEPSKLPDNVDAAYAVAPQAAVAATAGEDESGHSFFFTFIVTLCLGLAILIVIVLFTFFGRRRSAL